MLKNDHDLSKAYKIRKARSTDLDQLFHYLCELSKHEGNSDLFKMTSARLKDELFSMNADWNCLIAADHEDKVIGFCLYTFSNINRAFNTSPMIYIDHLFVTPEYRKKGIGRAFFNKLALIARKKNIGRFNVWCMKNNEIGQSFYKGLEAEKRDFVDIYSIQVNQLLDRK